MIIIPKDYKTGRYLIQDIDGQQSLTYMNVDKARLQVTRGPTSYSGFWTPGIPLGDCLRRIHTFGLMAYKEDRIRAEFSDGEKIDTRDWKPALERLCDSSDQELRFVEFTNADSRSVTIASLSDNDQLDIGISAELSLIGTLRDALLVTAAPKDVKFAFNRIVFNLFSAQEYNRPL